MREKPGILWQGKKRLKRGESQKTPEEEREEPVTED